VLFQVQAVLVVGLMQAALPKLEVLAELQLLTAPPPILAPLL
jgi:hypothetical protein